MFVGAFIERPRATNGRPYGKLPYENEPEQVFFYCFKGQSSLPIALQISSTQSSSPSTPLSSARL